MPFSFLDDLTHLAQAVEHRLESLLSAQVRDQEIARPERLLNAMRHGALGGGKRIRPYLVAASGDLFGVDRTAAVNVGAALECIHCYSLVHDDLPEMDNDTLRRGQPTVHVAYDPATAILAGDSLLTLAFDALTADDIHASPAVRLALVQGLARAAGLGGMAGGQMLDLQAERADIQSNGQAFDTTDSIRQLQAMKTGALIRFGCRAGGLLGEADPEHLALLSRFGDLIGFAFQLADDLLDIEATTEALGKTAGKDIEQGKATYISLKGAEWTKNQRDQLVEEAKSLLNPFGERAQALSAAADFIAKRSS